MVKVSAVASNLLEVKRLSQEFQLRKRFPFSPAEVVHAVSDVSFNIKAGECLGLVGETGCGKSTLAKTIMGITPPTGGDVLIEGASVAQARRRIRSARGGGMQYVFQDPFSSLDPTWQVASLVAEPLRIAGTYSRRKIADRVAELLNLTGLDPKRFGKRRPQELSGGQCQRVAVARALTVTPRLLICDEVVSGLDVSIQAQLLNLLERLRVELSLSYLFISHDLGVVHQVSDRIAVMYLGKIVEIGETSMVYQQPRHPYTAALLSAAPRPTTEKRGTRGEWRLNDNLPSPVSPPSGCRFHTRCPRAAPVCKSEAPALTEDKLGTQAFACHFPLTSSRISDSAPVRRSGPGLGE